MKLKEAKQAIDIKIEEYKKDLNSPLGWGCEDNIRGIISGLKEAKKIISRLEKQSKKNVEWSEEDERIKDNCVEYLKASCLNHKEFIECINWLEFLKERTKGE